MDRIDSWMSEIEGVFMDAETLLTIAVVIVALPFALLGGFAMVVAYAALDKEDSWEINGVSEFGILFAVECQ